MSPAEKQKRYRKRLREGEICVRVPVPPCVVEALLLSGRIDDAGSEDRNKIAGELEIVLREWAGEWRKIP